MGLFANWGSALMKLTSLAGDGRQQLQLQQQHSIHYDSWIPFGQGFAIASILWMVTATVAVPRLWQYYESNSLLEQRQDETKDYEKNTTAGSSQAESNETIPNRGRPKTAATTANAQQERQQQHPSLSSSAKTTTTNATETETENVNGDFDAPHIHNRVLRKAETVLQHRTSAVICIVEHCSNDWNYSAILRTVEALGVQHVWMVPQQQQQQEQHEPQQTTANGNDENNNNKRGDSKQSSACKGEVNDFEMNTVPSTNPFTRTSSIIDNNNARMITSMQGRPLQLTAMEMHVRKQHYLFAQRATEWLTVREFDSTSSCLDAVRQEGYALWVTDLSQQAIPLTQSAIHTALSQQRRRCCAQHCCCDAQANDFTNDNNPSTNGFKTTSCLWPDRVALVFGTEAVGCSTAMLEASDLRIYLPLVGFADSLNLSVAAALVLHHILVHMHPAYQKQMSEQERHDLRQQWYTKLLQQRHWTRGQKTQRKRLITAMKQCEELQRKQQSGHVLTEAQQAKLLQQSKWRNEWDQLKKNSAVADAAGNATNNKNTQNASHRLEPNNEPDLADTVAAWVQHPPEPFVDLRRADDHRIAFVGKQIKQKLFTT